MYTKTFSLPIFALMALLFLASCTADTSSNTVITSSSGIVQESHAESDRPSREGRGRHARGTEGMRDMPGQMTGSDTNSDMTPIGASEMESSPATKTITNTPKTSTEPAVSPAATSPSVDTATPVTTPTTSSKVSATTSTSPTTTSSPQTSGSTVNKSITYSTDRGKESVTATFSITTDSTGKITSTSASAVSADRESRQYISRFNSASKSQIVGKKISELSLSAVGGASDTTDAFLRAVGSL